MEGTSTPKIQDVFLDLYTVVYNTVERQYTETSETKVELKEKGEAGDKELEETKDKGGEIDINDKKSNTDGNEKKEKKVGEGEAELEHD